MQPDALTASLFARLAASAWNFSRRHWHLVVIAMLALLHVATLRGVADGWARALLLAHLGLLLLWQPFLRGEHRVTYAQGAFIAFAAAVVMLRLDWWLLAFWVVVLVGIVGGKVYQQDARWQRRFYLLVLGYLLALLAVVVLPEIAPRREITAEVRAAAEYGLPALFLPMALFPVEADSGEAPQVIDFFYSIFLMLVLGVIVLGSFTFMMLGRTAYLEALTYTVFLIAGAVLLIGLAWNPRTGFAGLNVFFSRYLFSIGLPVERWLYFLAELSLRESRPERFLADAVAGLVRLPWVAGAAWRAAHGQGESGGRTAHAAQFEHAELALTIWSRYRLSPALDWHLQLLGQLLAEFFVAKQREQKLQQASYLQAVHETGARLTHDMKNLMQSLNVLCSVAAQDGAGDVAERQALLRRQLPAIQQRVAEALGRLERPQSDVESDIAAELWWEGLVRQYRDAGVELAASGLRADAMLPGALFDSVADNLLHNALAKRRADPAIRVRATLDCAGQAPALRVEDSGAAIAPEIGQQLLRAPVRSATGLGIGLYQAARQAESLGYRLALEENREGAVRFALTAAPRLK